MLIYKMVLVRNELNGNLPAYNGFGLENNLESQFVFFVEKKKTEETEA